MLIYLKRTRFLHHRHNCDDWCYFSRKCGVTYVSLTQNVRLRTANKRLDLEAKMLCMYMHVDTVRSLAHFLPDGLRP